MKLSVIVLTSRAREANLQHCLKALCAQEHQDFELIIADDGSQDGREIAHDFCRHWPRLSHYDWRPHDYCMSRSYNRALAQVQTQNWVFLSSDVLLNPRALSYYALYLEKMPPGLIYGYFGNEREIEAESLWYPERRVNPVDSRFHFRPNGQLTCDPQIHQRPQSFAWGGNWALSGRLCPATRSLFNEDFVGWGLEDVDLANRLLAQGAPLSFSLDVWGEHQVHALQIDEEQYQKNQKALGPYAKAQHDIGLLYNPRDRRLFERLKALQQLET